MFGRMPYMSYLCTMIQTYAAPLQGFTDAAWRNAHYELMRCPDAMPPVYTMPFAMVERGAVRRRDINALTAPVPQGMTLIPQAIFKDVTELAAIAGAAAAAGHTALDLNMGCPFAPQVHAGRGAGATVRPDLLCEVAAYIAAHPGMRFSVKMRLGVSSPDEWRAIADILAGMSLTHITVHPRIAAQGYKGEPDTEAFAEMANALSHHKIIYNGDINTPEYAWRLIDRFPWLHGVMAGRGLLARPTLAAEIATGRTVPDAERRDAWLAMMRSVARTIAETSAGDNQALMRLRPRLDYTDPALFDRKFIKTLRKTSVLATWLSL